MNELKDLQTKDTLTKSDIKAIEDRLITQFNSRLTEFAKRVIETPAKSDEDISRIAGEVLQIYTSGISVPNIIDSIRSLKLD